MKMENIVWLCAGGILGLAVTLYEADPSPSNECVAYKIRPKPVTAYVLTPPPPIIRPAVCPVAPKCDVAKEEVFVSNAETGDEKAKEDKPRRRHGRHRVRRYWR